MRSLDCSRPGGVKFSLRQLPWFTIGDKVFLYNKMACFSILSVTSIHQQGLDITSVLSISRQTEM